MRTIIRQHPIKILPFTYQSLIDSVQLQPGWSPCPTVNTHHVLASTIQNECPTSLQKALHSINTDAQIWTRSYKEEYDTINYLGVYEETTMDTYCQIQHKCA